jgi:predicted permease
MHPPLLQVLSSSLRSLTKTPLFTTFAALYLALAIGGNTAIFSVVNAVLLRPLPFMSSEQLFVIRDRYQGPGSEPQSFRVSSFNFLARRNLREFRRNGALQSVSFSLTGPTAERIAAAAVSADFLPTLGVEPLLGRGFHLDEERPGAGHVALISQSFWARRFGRDPGALRGKLLLDGEPYTIVGVLPLGFTFPFVEADVWVPLALDPADSSTPAHRRVHELTTVSRLAPGVSAEHARAALKGLSRQLSQEYADTHQGWEAELVSLHEYRVGNVRRRFITLQLAAAFLLLVACANLSNLLLVRAERRSGEVALRLTLGATRLHIARQLLAESLLLALLGGATGVLLALWLLGPLLSLAPLELPESLKAISLNQRVLGFSLGAALLSGLLSSLTPLLKTVRPDIYAALRQGTRSSGSRASQRVLNGLVVFEVALAVVLLVGAGLMLRSFQRLQTVNPGFAPSGSVAVKMTVADQRYPEGHQRSALARQMLERVEALPGVRAAGITTLLPMSSEPRFGTFHIQGRAAVSDSEVLFCRYALVSPGYLQTMRIPILQGRHFTESDLPGAPGVVIISRAMARQYWPDRNPLGSRIQRGQHPGPDTPWLTVIGIAGDVHDAGPSAALEPMYYLPYDQHAGTTVARTFSLVVRAESDPTGLIAGLRREISAIDRDLPLYEISTLEEILVRSLAQPRFSALLLGSFAGLSLFLALAGIYGVMSYFVSQRDREMGIRTALGACSSDVLRLVLRRGARLTLLGFLFGIAGALALVRLLSSQLYQVNLGDFLAIAGEITALAVVAMVATYIPASRATRIDPLIVLKSG